MRKDALFIGLLGVGLLSTVKIVRADEGAPVCIACQGQSMETPNQRHKRLGEPIQATFPPVEYGEKLETPNQRRQRLGQTIASATPTVVGSSEETPNQKRQRLASEASLADSRH